MEAGQLVTQLGDKDGGEGSEAGIIISMDTNQGAALVMY